MLGNGLSPKPHISATAGEVMCEVPQCSILIPPGQGPCRWRAHRPITLESFLEWILTCNFFSLENNRVLSQPRWPQMIHNPLPCEKHQNSAHYDLSGFKWFLGPLISNRLKNAPWGIAKTLNGTCTKPLAPRGLRMYVSVSEARGRAINHAAFESAA